MNERPNTTYTEPAVDVLARNGRSFWLASLFLSKTQQSTAARLYAFCRWVDDAVDEAESKAVAGQAIMEFRAELNLTRPAQACVQNYLELTKTHGLPKWAALDLLDGMESDLELVRIRTHSDFLLYCYRVAGTVGVMMCGVLGVTHPHATEHAIRLGLAMQITNICRDVLEDAKMGRVYLPEEVLRQHGLTHDDILSLSPSPEKVTAAVHELLDLADRLYAQGRAGFRFIPWRARFTIHVAAAVYQQIGWRLRRVHHSNPMHGRTIVPMWEKITAILRHTARAALGRNYAAEGSPVVYVPSIDMIHAITEIRGSA